MRKTLTIFGLLFLTAGLLVQPAKADSINNTVNYHLTGHGLNVTFSLPQIFTPAGINYFGAVFVNNISGTLLAAFPGTITYAQIDLGNSGVSGVTNYWSFGSTGPELGLYAAGLLTVNPDGTVTLNSGTFALGDYHLFQGGSTYDYTLTAVDPPGINAAVRTPEPASLLLLGFGGLALGALRRRKAA